MSQDLMHLSQDRDPTEVLFLNFDAWEGPLDVLLHLAREQKVDLAQISILSLVDQYIHFIRQAKRLRIELAADYLVMAAWLTYLKSKILLPNPEPEDDHDSQQVVRDLKFHLRRLDAMRQVGQALLDRPQLGLERLARGFDDTPNTPEVIRWTASLHDLLSAYGRISSLRQAPQFNFARPHIVSIEAALQRLRHLLEVPIPIWSDLASFLPPDLDDPQARRSGMASTFVAALELAKTGAIDIKQDESFGPIHLKTATRGDLL